MSARVDLQRPERGLADICWRAQSLRTARLLQLGPCETGVEQRLTDAHIRGSDLVAAYETVSGRSLATQVYWRYVEHVDLAAAGAEIVISVQTELLDADPSLSFGSEVACTGLIQPRDMETTEFSLLQFPATRPATSLHRQGVGLFIRRLNDAVSYVEMVHPADFSSVEFLGEMSPSGTVRSRFPLFQERLEKGVIRRARAQGLLCPREGDQTVAHECYRRLLASESPLTA